MLRAKCDFFSTENELLVAYQYQRQARIQLLLHPVIGNQHLPENSRFQRS
jgi:hypothetical protein